MNHEESRAFVEGLMAMIEPPHRPPPDGLAVELEHSSVKIIGHNPRNCKGETCCLHNRSDHRMRDFPQHWREDRKLMERMCAHGVGHPDPDALAHIEAVDGKEAADIESVHGCDGCCSAATAEERAIQRDLEYGQ